jgi:hypothetical protein
MPRLTSRAAQTQRRRGRRVRFALRSGRAAESILHLADEEKVDLPSSSHVASLCLRTPLPRTRLILCTWREHGAPSCWQSPPSRRTSSTACFDAAALSRYSVKR